MAAPKLKYSIGNGASTTSTASITGSDTSIALTATTNFQAATTPGEGMILINETGSSEEIAYSTGLSGSSLTIPLANRGLEGGSAASHNSNETVKGVLTAGMWNDLIDALVTNLLTQSTGATKSGISLTSPKITTDISDSNGNELFKVTATASAVNEVTVTNAATGTNPTLSATGGDSTAALGLKGKSAYVLASGEYDNGNSGASKTISWLNGDHQKLTVTASTTLTYSNAVAGQTLTLRIVEDGTGGFSITLPTTKWPGGTVGTFTTTANAINLLVIYYDGTNYLTQLAAGFA